MLRESFFKKFLLAVIIGFPTAGLTLFSDHSQIMRPSAITSSVDEGADIEFTFNREGSTDFDPAESETFATITPTSNFNVLIGNDDTDGREFTITTREGDIRGIGQVSTLNNSVVNAKKSIRTELQNFVVASLLPQIAGTPTSMVFDTIDYAGDHVSSMSTPPPPSSPGDTNERKHIGRLVQAIAQDDSTSNPLTRCAGTHVQGVMQDCDYVRLGRNSRAASPPELTQLATVQKIGHQTLFDARGESDAAVLPTDIFSQTLISTSDITDEDDGDYRFHTTTNPETSTKSARIERNDQPWISLQAFDPGVTGQRASNAEVTEGSRVFFFIDRSPNQPAMNVRIWLDYHSKIFDSDLPTPSNQHLVQFSEGQQLAVISFDTHDDGLNEGDGMIRADLDTSPTAISAYRVDSESAWFRVVDNDIPEVTLSLSTNSSVEGEPPYSIVEGEPYSWILKRDCCTESNLYVAALWEQVYFYPDDVWEDLTVSRTLNERLDTPNLAGFISAGNTLQEWRRTSAVSKRSVKA